ncbi:MAG: leucyl aminopeptidase [Proteobacteria bacterium]|nr:leucyl aminopeptidase [Pseudomonadota bacterium]
MRVGFTKVSMPPHGVLVVPVLDGRKLTATGATIDKRMGGALMRAIRAGHFKGAAGQLLEIVAPSGLKVSRIIAVGLGKPADIGALTLEAAGGSAVAKVLRSGEATIAFVVDPIKGCKVTAGELAARIANGAVLGSYTFDHYRTTLKAEQKPSLKTVNVMVANQAAARKAYAPLAKVAEGVFFTRDLVTQPANIIYPKTLAQEARKLSKLGVKVEVLGRARMEQLGMGALLGVAQGSVREPQMVVMRYDGGKRGQAPLAFVGKGVTFDTGGISIKPAQGMEDMKWDMGGSAVVIGLMRALAGRKAKCNVIGVVGLVENMPDGNAQRPGDVVTSMSGQTIEVINTDAEGRLVLADALWYTQKRFKPKLMIDLATLTGAIIVALGNDQAGMFASDDKLAERLHAAGQGVGELLWRLPMSTDYDKLINSDIADMKNVGERGAGSITAAQFLQRFTNNVPWAHLDIAGVTWSKKPKPTVPKGGTGFGVRLLDEFVAANYEK